MGFFQFSNIGVGSPERHGQGLKDSYISYRIVSTLEGDQFNVSRRYNDFCELRQNLADNLPSVILPPLPEKQSLAQLMGSDRFNPDMIKRRQIGLTRWLKRINCHTRISQCGAYRDFMCNATTPDYRNLNYSEDGLSNAAEEDLTPANEEEFSKANGEIDLLNKHLKELSRQSEKWNKNQRGSVIID
jgi:hypothetical protein